MIDVISAPTDDTRMSSHGTAPRRGLRIRLGRKRTSAINVQVEARCCFPKKGRPGSLKPASIGRNSRPKTRRLADRDGGALSTHDEQRHRDEEEERRDRSNVEVFAHGPR